MIFKDGIKIIITIINLISTFSLLANIFLTIYIIFELNRLRNILPHEKSFLEQIKSPYSEIDFKGIETINKSNQISNLEKNKVKAFLQKDFPLSNPNKYKNEYENPFKTHKSQQETFHEFSHVNVSKVYLSPETTETAETESVYSSKYDRYDKFCEFYSQNANETDSDREENKRKCPVADLETFCHFEYVFHTKMCSILYNNEALNVQTCDDFFSNEYLIRTATKSVLKGNFAEVKKGLMILKHYCTISREKTEIDKFFNAYFGRKEWWFYKRKKIDKNKMIAFFVFLLCFFDRKFTILFVGISFMRNSEKRFYVDKLQTASGHVLVENVDKICFRIIGYKLDDLCERLKTQIRKLLVNKF